MVIRAKSARSIQAYTVVPENEYILLPGVRLRVDEIKTRNGRFDGKPIRMQFVELTEI